jgi:hypothetical protein
MGQRVYLLCVGRKENVVGIYANIRQVRKNLKLITSQDKPLLFEIRINEPPCDNFGKDCSFMLELPEPKEDSST